MATTDKQKIGRIGEGVAAKYLENHDFKIRDKNYWKKWGEIDIVAERTKGKEGQLHFIEVKTVSHGPRDNDYEPEDLVHEWKRKRLRRVIEVYMLEKNIDSDFQVDVIVVYLDMATSKAKVKYLPDIEL